jgi:FSR family fosmidomycin resistance protein-like MFS transporter
MSDRVIERPGHGPGADPQTNSQTVPRYGVAAEGTVMIILLAISFSHFLNDSMQSLLPAIYPLLKHEFNLNFVQIGFLTFTFQVTASLLQPLIGLYTDRKPQPFSLASGMVFTFVGLVLLGFAWSFVILLVAAALIGLGSSVFHPESSRVARMSSGGRHGFAQSVFQVGGNAGTAMGPLLAAFLVVPFGQHSIIWSASLALIAILVLAGVGRWYHGRLLETARRPPRAVADVERLPGRRVAWAMVVLTLLVFSKYFYLTSLTSYYTFYLIHRFHLGVQAAQIYLFVFLGAVALGTLVGGPIGDRIGRKPVIWVSILGILPFTLALPFVGLFWTAVLSVIIGVILASAMPAIVVYAQELMPGKVGTVSGLFLGLAFGMGGLGAALIGLLADHAGIVVTYQICSLLPLIGLLGVFLPDIGGSGRRAPRRGKATGAALSSARSR